MTSVFCLLNHTLTGRQLQDLQDTYGADVRLFTPPDAVSKLWAQVPPEGALSKELLRPVFSWLETSAEHDVIIVQGDFGATFAVVDWALSHGRVPLYATTQRIEAEERDGEKVYRHYVFEHIGFRPYQRYADL